MAYCPTLLSPGRIAAQLHSGGVNAVMDMMAGYPIGCASAPQTGGAHPPDVMFPEERALAPSSKITRMPVFKALDDEDIALLIRRFADGADAITVSARHNYAVARALTESWLPQQPDKLIPLAERVKAVKIPAIKATGVETHIVGDCNGVGYIQDAIRDAAEVAARIQA